MLKPFHRVTCSPALAACQQLMRRFALWLCDPQVSGASVTQANLQANMGSAIEGDWLWLLLAGSTGTKALLDKAKRIADLPLAEKNGLQQWIHAVNSLVQHFGPTPPASLPVNPPNGWRARDQRWTVFKDVMVAFYEEGLHGRGGLPYAANGAPTGDVALRVSYDHFVREFRAAHRLDPHPDAREVCVLCGGPLVLPAVDHWLAKTAFPLLAVCADNLLPICGECNVAPQKGQKDVHIRRRVFRLVPPLSAPCQRGHPAALRRCRLGRARRERNTCRFCESSKPGQLAQPGPALDAGVQSRISAPAARGAAPTHQQRASASAAPHGVPPGSIGSRATPRGSRPAG